MPDDPSTDPYEVPADASAEMPAEVPADASAEMPAEMPADAVGRAPADPAPDPGRPDPPPVAPSPWSMPGDAAVLNPLAPAGAPDVSVVSDVADVADVPATLSALHEEPAWHAEPAEASMPSGQPFDAGFLDDGSADAFPAFPAPAPAPGAPAAVVPFDSAPPLFMPAPFGGLAPDAGSAVGSADDVLSAAAPSSPSVPWDRHQAAGPPAPPRMTRGARLVTAAGANVLYVGSGVVIALLALTALFFNVFVRAGDAGDKAASAVSMDGSADNGIGLSAPREGDAAPDEAGAAVGAAEALTATGGASDPASGGSAADGTMAGGTAADGKAADGTARTQGIRATDAAADVEGAFVVPDGYRRYDDLQHGFSLRVPADWREAHRSAGPADGADGPDYDVVFESARGEQRLAVSVWGAGERAPFEAWLAATVAGMRPLDGALDGSKADGDGVPYNAFLAGEPALVLGAAETPVSHLSYAAYLQHADRYLRIAWADMTGLTRPDDVLGALASFGWVGDGIVTGSAPQANQVPWLRLPQGVYWPSEALFGEG